MGLGVAGSCGGLFTSAAIILVLFILLVIITRGFLY
ncbi:dihydroorotate dehydrogenase [Paenibacillus sp. NPDC056579]|nr:dihydroorotate dehydrogenase [Paenibacillus sp. H1-7]ULL16715.1 dihydroorotate dehydrogenase [Paenibacillus sp. H1-7]